MNIEDLQRVKSDYENGVLVNRVTQLQVLEAALSAVAPLVQCVPQSAELHLSRQGVFKGVDGLRKLAECDEFWREQPYGTRLDFGPNISDYLHRDVLRAAVRALDASPLGALPAPVVQPIRNEVLEEAAQAIDSLADRLFDGEELVAAIECIRTLRAMKNSGGAE